MAMDFQDLISVGAVISIASIVIAVLMRKNVSVSILRNIASSNRLEKKHLVQTYELFSHDILEVFSSKFICFLSLQFLFKHKNS